MNDHLHEGRVLGGALARNLRFEEIELVSGANPQLNSRCVFPYMETTTHHILVCDPCDDVGFP